MLKSRAFTIIELLTVLVVVSILAAILFPVFDQAKKSAIQTSCLGRFHQVSEATHLYLGDYDDYFMPVNYQPGAAPNAKTDRTWVQMLLPYTEMLLPYSGSFKTFRCPADSVSVDQTMGIFDQDLVPGDLFARYYTASMHVNMGYNFQYLAPILQTGQTWSAQPKNLDQLADPTDMLEFIDSAWEVENGQPEEGGSWLVSPPCRYQNVNGQLIDTIGPTASVDGANQSPTVYAPVAGWQTPNQPGAVFGGAWPWHSGKLTVATIEGTVRPITIAQLGSGCEILPSWSGEIQNRSLYLWSPQ